MASRGPNNIFSGEPLPIAPKINDPEIDAFNRKLLDYLRRLVGKLSRFSNGDGGGTTVQVFAASTSVDLNPGAGATLPLPWDTEIRRDSIYTLSVGNTVIRVSETGFYVVEVDVTVNKNFQFRVMVSIVDSGGTEIVTEDYMKSDVTGPSTGQTYSFMVPVNLTAGDYISTILYVTDGVNDAAILKLGTRVLVTKIADEA